jgi:hypothetical protein
MFLAVLLTTLVATPPPERSSRAWLAEVALEGPLGGVVLDMGASGETRLVGALVAGETRRIVVPLPARTANERFTPSIHVAPLADWTAAEQGAARFVRWLEPEGASIEDLPPGLRARARPPVARDVVRPSVAALLALAALGAATVGLAERGRTALFAALATLVGTAAITWLEPVRASDFEAHVILVEADSQSAAWLEVEAAPDRLDVVPPIDALSIEVWPPGARLVWRVPLGSEPVLDVSGHAVRLYRLSVFDPGEERIDPRQNRFAPISQAWVREAGEWRSHGAWPLGEPLPAPLAREADGPPGWLASGLPQGPAILIARIDPQRSPRPALSATSVYLRLANFD